MVLCRIFYDATVPSSGWCDLLNVGEEGSIFHCILGYCTNIWQRMATETTLQAKIIFTYLTEYSLELMIVIKKIKKFYPCHKVDC